MKLRVPASRDVRRVLDALLFYSGLGLFAAAPWLILHLGWGEAFSDLVVFLFTVRHYR